MTRLLVFTGKGGVGKTSVAAATALATADAGARTLVLSTDTAHSLADALDVPLDGRPTPVTNGLWGQQLDPTERFEEAWGDIQRYLQGVLEWAGVDGVEAEELSLLPGLEEVFALTDLHDLAGSGDWDVIVVDCAPTAETIRLLSLPDVLGWYMQRVFPVGRTVTRLARPLLTRVGGLPVADEPVFDAVAGLHERLSAVKALLADRERATVRLVVNPERIVVAEARRTATYLALFGYGVDAVIVNRMLPEAVTDPWFKAWRETQAEHLVTIEEGFAPLPVLTADLASEELVGVERLRDFGGALYDSAGLDARAVLHAGEGMRIERHDGDPTLVLELPFADGDELEVGRREDELLVRVGPYRRAVLLPDSLRRREVVSAALRRGRLEVRFATGER